MASQTISEPVKIDQSGTVLETVQGCRVGRPQSDASMVESSTELKRWVLQQSPGTYIWAEDLQNRHPTPEVVLNELTQSHPHVIGKVEVLDNIYFMHSQEHELALGHYPYLADAGVQRAGEGSGYAHATALNAMSWSWHPTRQTWISTLNNTTTTEPHIAFEKSNNQQRRLLNPVEVSVLEAMLAVNDSYPHRDWDTRYEMFISGFSITRLAKNSYVRMPLLRQVAEYENPRRPDAFWNEFDQLSQACPDCVEALTSEQLSSLFVAV